MYLGRLSGCWRLTRGLSGALLTSGSKQRIPKLTAFHAGRATEVKRRPGPDAQPCRERRRGVAEGLPAQISPCPDRGGSCFLRALFRFEEGPSHV